MEKKWSYKRALQLAEEVMKETGIPNITMDANADANLDFIDVIHASNKKLE